MTTKLRFRGWDNPKDGATLDDITYFRDGTFTEGETYYYRVSSDDVLFEGHNFVAVLVISDTGYPMYESLCYFDEVAE